MSLQIAERRTRLSLIEVCFTKTADPLGSSLLSDLEEMGLKGLESLHTCRLYEIQGEYGPEELSRIGAELLADPVVQAFSTGRREIQGEGFRLEVWLKPGVMDPVSASVRKGIRDLGLPAPIGVRCGGAILFLGKVSRPRLEQAIQRLLVNPVIHEWTLWRILR